MAGHGFWWKARNQSWPVVTPTYVHRYPLSRPWEYPTGMFTLYTPCTRPVQGPIPVQGEIFGPTGWSSYRATAYATPVSRGSALPGGCWIFVVYATGWRPLVRVFHRWKGGSPWALLDPLQPLYIARTDRLWSASFQAQSASHHCRGTRWWRAAGYSCWYPHPAFPPEPSTTKRRAVRNKRQKCSFLHTSGIHRMCASLKTRMCAAAATRQPFKAEVWPPPKKNHREADHVVGTQTLHCRQYRNKQSASPR